MRRRWEFEGFGGTGGDCSKVREYLREVSTGAIEARRLRECWRRDLLKLVQKETLCFRFVQTDSWYFRSCKSLRLIVVLAALIRQMKYLAESLNLQTREIRPNS